MVDGHQKLLLEIDSQFRLSNHDSSSDGFSDKLGIHF